MRRCPRESEGIFFMGYVQGEGRTQATLFPVTLEELIPDDPVCRVIDSLVLNVGTKNGVRVGDVLQISRVVRTVKDPATGKVIKSIANKIGDAKVTDVDENSATVIFTGAEVAVVGDAVS